MFFLPLFYFERGGLVINVGRRGFVQTFPHCGALRAEGKWGFFHNSAITITAVQNHQNYSFAPFFNLPFFHSVCVIHVCSFLFIRPAELHSAHVFIHAFLPLMGTTDQVE